MAKSTVQLIATGGTISCLPGPDGSGLRPSLSAIELAKQAGDFPEITVTAMDASIVSGWNMTLGHMHNLSRLVARAVEDGATGVVVAHGTDTLEETATFLDVSASEEIPVVVTGAMRHAAAAGADGPANLRDAVLVASDPAAKERGALVVFGGRVWSASGVRKVHTSRPDAFSDSSAGPLGEVTADDQGCPVHWWSPPWRRPTLKVATVDFEVVIMEASPGQDSCYLSAMVDAHPDGLVLSGTGMGHVPGGWVPVLAAAVKSGLSVVMTTRIGDGPVGPHYGGPGGGFEIAAMGIFGCGFRSPQRARIELACALGAGLKGTHAARWVADRESC